MFVKVPKKLMNNSIFCDHDIKIERRVVAINLMEAALFLKYLWNKFIN